MNRNDTKTKNAVVWIRDGVLVDRMYINPVAFAFAAWKNIPVEYQGDEGLLEELINFGFAKSGYSAAEKMELYNREKRNIIKNVQAAARDYDKIATKAAESAQYFPGAVDLLKNLHERGVLNFITSAVNQEVLDEWKQNDVKGKIISPFLTEILGFKPGFKKGKDHFEHIVKKYNVDKIYYVADAVSEIRTGNEFSRAYNIVSIGFAHVVSVEDVMRGVGVITQTMKEFYNINSDCFDINPEKLILSSETEIIESLKNASAEKIIIDGSNGIIGIMQNLKDYFHKIGLI